MELPRQIVELWAPSLESVSLDGLSSLENLPVIIDCLAKSASRLTKLSILGVANFMDTGSVESWPLKNLQELGISFGDGITEKVDGMLQSCCSSLTTLELRGMDDSECLPQSIQCLAALDDLELVNIGMEELPEWLGRLPSLQRLTLTLTSCSKLRRLPTPSGGAFTQLRYLDIRDCPLLHDDSEWQYNRHHLIIVIMMESNHLENMITSDPSSCPPAPICDEIGSSVEKEDYCEDDDSEEEYSIQRPAFSVSGEPDFDSGPPLDGL